MKPGDNAPGDDKSAEGVLKRHILSELEECNYNISEVARRVKLTRQTIANYVKRWGLTRGLLGDDPPDSEPPKK